MTRGAALLALAYTAALAIWITGRLALGDAAHPTGIAAAGALLISQCIVAVLAAPWLAGAAGGERMTGLVPLVITPWPLLVLVVKISGISTLTMVASQFWVGALIVLSYLGARGVLRILREAQLQTIALTIMQVVPAVALWAGRETWVPWFTG